MKKLLAIVLTAVMLFTLSSVAFAVNYDQVFDAGTLGSKTYRIPAIYTLNDGSVIAGADIRYDHGKDSPNNIDTAIAVSANGYTGWEYQVVNRFDDYADGTTDTYSASFIDSAIVQDSNDRIYLVTDAWTSDGGYLAAKRGSGYTEIDGKKYMLLTTGNNTDDLSSFGYYIADFAGDFAPVLKVSDSSATAYTVDKEYRLYKNGTALMMKQYGSDKQVQQNVFYNDAELCCYNTCYLWLRTSDDNGKTWSDPTIITPQVKSEKEGFLGICPGRGYVTTLADGTERVIFMVYDNLGAGDVLWNEMENVSTIYSDDGGVTWKRGAETTSKVNVGKTSESQMVALNNGVLRLYARNGSDYIAYADSTDGGVTWSKFVRDLELGAMGNCMCSFINTSKTINGKKVILGSFPSNQSERADGVIKTGVVNDDNTVEWIATYHVNDGFFAYSCLTELADGNIAYLYEDEAYHIQSMVLTMDAEGNLSEINGNNCEYEENLTLWQKIVKFFKDLFIKLQQWLGIA